MGEEKGLVEFYGKSFVQWILDAVVPLVPVPVLVTQNPAYRYFGLEMIPDLIADQGPLGGIYTALSHSDADSVLILSCDVPKITAEVLAFLAQQANGQPGKITFLSDGKNDYPLIGIYPRQYLRTIEKSILNGELKLRRLVGSLPHQRIELSSNLIAVLQNINTPVELLSLS